jgi:hypothetical protein|tara:strand:+ start:8 stop:157 length:150 start_codon:yes stop_codon:yes gene_type:complete
VADKFQVTLLQAVQVDLEAVVDTQVVHVQPLDQEFADKETLVEKVEDLE